MSEYVVRRDGTIVRGGRAVGVVWKMGGASTALVGLGPWRAEVGSLDEPETYRAVYARTRREAVEGALEEPCGHCGEPLAEPGACDECGGRQER